MRRNWTHQGTGVVLKGSQGDSVAAVEVPVQVGSAAQVNLLIVARLAVGVEAEQSAKARKGGRNLWKGLELMKRQP